MKMLQIMKKLKHELQWIGEKCTYIEQRIDAAAAKSGETFAGICSKCFWSSMQPEMKAKQMR
jgi:hypothetical protein